MKITNTLQIPCGQTYLMRTHEGYFIEAGDVFMSSEKGLGTRPYHFRDFENPSDLEKRVMTISTMAGCPCKCEFCASRKSFKRNLSGYEIADQVKSMEYEGTRYGRIYGAQDAKEFRVLFTRMGEPMLNVDNVIDGIRRLIAMYPYNILIGMSTSGYKAGLAKFMTALDILPYIDMQFSVHSTSQDQRDLLFDTTKNMALEELAVAASEWFHLTGNKVGLNFILFEHGEYDFVKLVDELGFNPKHVWVRLSPWNVVEGEFKFRSLLNTDDVIVKKPITSERLKDVIANLERSRISYSYAPAIDEEIKHNVACGQALAAFKHVPGVTA